MERNTDIKGHAITNSGPFNTENVKCKGSLEVEWKSIEEIQKRGCEGGHPRFKVWAQVEVGRGGTAKHNIVVSEDIRWSCIREGHQCDYFWFKVWVARISKEWGAGLTLLILGDEVKNEVSPISSAVGAVRAIDSTLRHRSSSIAKSTILIYFK